MHVTYEDLRDNLDATYDHATHYDYDIHGNVESMLQDNFKLAKDATDIANQRFKKLDYKYDLISGNVHRVSYQAGQKDQWHHTYTYDADNRITNTYTTTATPISGSLSLVRDFQVEPGMSPYWDLEASYEYYDHGPLARTELAAEKAQGVDYVYTLQGWMKGMNSNNLTTASDPGKDGITSASNHQKVAVDVAGFSLQYYNGDFVAATAANGNFVATQTGSDLDANSNELYNGNIGTMVTTITDPNTRAILPLGNAYKYDQLNRLADAKSFTNLVGNAWGTGGAGKYENNFTYDANGNILTQKRYTEKETAPASGVFVTTLEDDLVYKYDDVGTNRKRNRLYHVDDNQSNNTTFTDDVDDMGTFVGGANVNASNNYIYDAEGRLTKDSQEGIRQIVWRVDGKVKEIFRLDNTKKRIRFDYDAMGHRIAKHVGTTNTANTNPATNFILESSTYYVLDAQGNTMSVYERTVNGIAASIKYEQAEKHIYGSSRLGVMNVAVNLLGTAGTAAYSQTNWTHRIGQRTYELSNHLGNVLSVISDKVIPHASGGSVAYYKADILQAQDYSPFGVTLKNRGGKKTGLSDKFRFGFQDQEMDDELKGEGNSVNYTFRMHDPRLGRFFAIDPLVSNYPFYSPYAFSGNEVIAKVELEGLEPSAPPESQECGTKKQGPYNGILYNWTVRCTDNSKTWDIGTECNFLEQSVYSLSAEGMVNPITPANKSVAQKTEGTSEGGVVKTATGCVADVEQMVKTAQFYKDNDAYSYSMDFREQEYKLDCSEYTGICAKAGGINDYPSTAKEQYEYFDKNYTTLPHWSQAQIGDMVFWDRSTAKDKSKMHTGIVVKVENLKSGEVIVYVLQAQLHGGVPPTVVKEIAILNEKVVGKKGAISLPGELSDFHQPFIALGRFTKK